MENLVEETIEEIKGSGHTESDVRWVGSYDGKYGMSWADFKRKFRNVIYNCGFGAQEIADDLVVVGDDWWLERYEYDGAEYWKYKKLPMAKQEQLSFDDIKSSRVCQKKKGE